MKRCAIRRPPSRTSTRSRCWGSRRGLCFFDLSAAEEQSARATRAGARALAAGVRCRQNGQVPSRWLTSGGAPDSQRKPFQPIGGLYHLAIALPLTKRDASLHARRTGVVPSRTFRRSECRRRRQTRAGVAQRLHDYGNPGPRRRPDVRYRNR
jgi:hypothetical protein